MSDSDRTSENGYVVSSRLPTPSRRRNSGAPNLPVSPKARGLIKQLNRLSGQWEGLTDAMGVSIEGLHSTSKPDVMNSTHRGSATIDTSQPTIAPSKKPPLSDTDIHWPHADASLYLQATQDQVNRQLSERLRATDTQIAQLLDANALLVHEVNRADETAAALRLSATKAEEQVAAYRQELHKVQAELEQLKAQFMACSHAAQLLGDERVGFADEAALLRNQAQAYRADLQALAKERLELLYVSTSPSLAEAEARLELLQHRCRGLTGLVATSHFQLNLAKEKDKYGSSDRSELQAQLGAQKRELTEAHTEIEMLKSALREAEFERRRLAVTPSIEAVERERDQLAARLRFSEEERTVLQERLRGLADEATSLRLTKTTETLRTDTIEQRIRELERELHSCETRRQEEAKRRERAEATAQSLQAQLVTVDAERSGLAQAASGMRGFADEAERWALQLQTERERLATAITEKERLARRAAVLSDENAELSSRVRDLTSAARHAPAVSTEQLLALREQLSRSEERANALFLEAERMAARAGTAEAESKSLLEELHIAQHHLEEAVSTRHRLERELAQARDTRKHEAMAGVVRDAVHRTREDILQSERHAFASQLLLGIEQLEAQLRSTEEERVRLSQQNGILVGKVAALQKMVDSTAVTSSTITEHILPRTVDIASLQRRAAELATPPASSISRINTAGATSSQRHSTAESYVRVARQTQSPASAARKAAAAFLSPPPRAVPIRFPSATEAPVLADVARSLDLNGGITNTSYTSSESRSSAGTVELRVEEYSEAPLDDSQLTAMRLQLEKEKELQQHTSRASKLLEEIAHLRSHTGTFRVPPSTDLTPHSGDSIWSP